MRIVQSARRHGISDDAMMHAVRQAIAEIWTGDDALLMLGADDSGRLLEVVVSGPYSEDPVIIHAMAMRPKYIPALRRR